MQEEVEEQLGNLRRRRRLRVAVMAHHTGVRADIEGMLLADLGLDVAVVRLCQRAPSPLLENPTVPDPSVCLVWSEAFKKIGGQSPRRLGAKKSCGI